MKRWWRESIFYQIYMPSFYDGNNDGIGDFKGIIKKLHYLQQLGVKGIWLTPFFPSPKVDNGYDISDYYDIDKDYGDLQDFEKFIVEAHSKGIKVIIDLVLNHTSSSHKWFLESKKSKDNPKRDWYIWKAPKEGSVPNNWESFFGEEAWEYDDNTKEYYYHAFAKEQVDLNWANPEVKEAMFNVMKFWFDKGVDGFRLDVINFLTVNDSFKDNPYDKEGKQIHKYDKDQDGILEIIKEINHLVHSYKDKFIVGEVGSEDINELKEYCGKDKLDVVFNFNFGSIKELDVEKLFSEISKMNYLYKEDQIPTVFFGSHDMPRYFSRLANEDIEKAKALSALLFTLKGVPFIYFGDEIAMKDYMAEDISKMRDVQGIIKYNQKIEMGVSKEEAIISANKESRDKSRATMQWNGAKYKGFSKVRPWLFNDEDETSVESQQLKEGSMLEHYKKLLNLRNEEEVLQYGEYTFIKRYDKVLFYEREFNGSKVKTVINLGLEDFELKPYFGEIDKKEILLSSDKFHLNSMILKENQFLIIK